MKQQQADQDLRNERWGYGIAHFVLIYLVALLLALPLFIVVHPYVPEMVIPLGGGIRVDMVLTFAVIIGSFIILVRRFQLGVYVALLVGVIAMTITGLSGVYGFSNLYEDYAGLLRSLHNTSVRVPLAANRLDPFPRSAELRAAVDLRNEKVRNFAVASATKHFTQAPVEDAEFTLVQSFSIFKEVNSNWRYVADPLDGEYFAKASESIDHLAGDCDDHAVLMAACIEAIGGEVRLVRTTGHIFPELRIGNDADFERAAYLIRKVLFPNEVGDAPLYYHTDADGQHWINLDYTRHYPGGEMMNEEVLGILVI